ncbi:PIG-L family deacetylase [Candidatus Saccharibacteria bacterium]|nr:PIG-L family deacetylase [Candidatus Saccharibacteria bacterium]
MWYKKLTNFISQNFPSFTNRVNEFKQTINTPDFARRYAIFSVVILLGTSFVWALLAASLQRGNADQSINSYLFDSSATFNEATLPAAHSFLIKWPLFFFLHLFGVSGFSLAFFTVLTVLITVSVLALIIRKIESRPLYFGTICLALASVLLLVPAQPYAGGLLPVNMAMIATRNLEYVLYIASLIVLIKSPRLKSISFWLATSFLALLIASDKLFLSLSLGGAILALLAYRFSSQRLLAKLSAKWLMSGLIATAAAGTILWGLNKFGVTHIANQTGLGPYSLFHGFHNLGLGIIYAFLGLLTNFGANPAFDATIFRNVPTQLQARLVDVGGPAFLINAAIFVVGLFLVLRLILNSLNQTTQRDKPEPDQSLKLSLLLIWTSVAAMVVFVLTNHYYAVDARYLTITLFTLFIAGAAYLRQTVLRPKMLVAAGMVMSLGIILGITVLARTYDAGKDALSETTKRNLLVAQALSHHSVNTLVGDYWRVIPTRLASKNRINVMPLAACTKPRDSLTTLAWQPDLKTTSFAYLLSLDKSLTDYPHCTLDQVVAAYGRPNSSTLIAGSLENPKELVLFYDKGINKTSPRSSQAQQAPSTVLPTSLDKLANVHCDGPTIMNIVAHQDDDLLFMNPDLLHEVKTGNCIRTIYITAGDAGSGEFYWLSREQGSESAYSKMLNYSGVWIKRIVKIADNQFIRVDNPKGNSKVSLIFLRLPDGNTRGQGFKVNNFESLEKLQNGKISVMYTVGHQSFYSYQQLEHAIVALMQTYKPTEIHTQANYISKKFPDHSDHMAVGYLARQAWEQYDIRVPIKFYIGYPIYENPVNVSDQDLQDKQAAFFAYGQFDSGVCDSVASCDKSKTSYGAYLPRQYTVNE